MKGKFRISPVAWIAIVYSISFGTMLFNDGIFWDDWCFYNQSLDTLTQYFKHLGFFLYWPAFLHHLLSTSFIGVLLERLVIFFSFLLSSIALYKTLGKIKQIGPDSRLWIVLLFAVFPLNFARISICVTHYAVSYLFFFAGLSLLSEYLSEKRKRAALRVFSLALFFLSFSTNSILFFYGIAIVYLIYFHFKGVTDGKPGKRLSENQSGMNFLIKWKLKIKEAAEFISRFRLISFLKLYPDFLLLPFLFFAVKQLFFMPFGKFSDYNFITWDHLAHIPSNFIIIIRDNFLGRTISSLQQPQLIYAVLLGAAALFFTKKFVQPLFTGPAKEVKGNRPNYDWAFILFGIFLLLLGAFPYLSVGKVPFAGDWESRHELLLPLGSAFLFYFSTRFLINRKLLNAVLFIFLCAFCLLNLKIQMSFYQDWLKQQSIIEHMKKDPEFLKYRTFVFRDNTAYLNANSRVIRFYEITGIMKYVFHDQKRFGMFEWEYSKDYPVGQFIKSPEYNITEYVPGSTRYLVTINPGKYGLGAAKTIQLAWERIVNGPLYQNDIYNLLSIDFSPWKERPR